MYIINVRAWGLASEVEELVTMITIPDLKGNEGQVLYILGNGFDLCHELPTRYSDFCDWLEHHGERDFVNLMEKIFPLENGVHTRWCNFENALGMCDVDLIYNDFYETPVNILADNAVELAVQNVVDIVSTTTAKIRPLMKEWINSIIIPSDASSQRFLLNKDDWFLNFNYTSTVENLYGIPNEHVCHIHGSVDSYNELITGHDKVLDDSHYFDTIDIVDVAKKKIVSFLNGLKKKQAYHYENCISFFLSLPKITDVVVIGHSLDSTDKYYFNKISSIIAEDARWHFSVYQPIDHHRISRFKKILPFLQNVNVWEFPLNP